MDTDTYTDTDIGMTVQPIKIQRSVQTQMRCTGRKGARQIYIYILINHIENPNQDNNKIFPRKKFMIIGV